MKLFFEAERNHKFFPLTFRKLGRGHLQLTLPPKREGIYVKISLHPDQAVVGCNLCTGAFLLPEETTGESFPLFYRRAEGILMVSFRKGRLVYDRIRLFADGDVYLDEATEAKVGKEAWAQLQIAAKLAQGIVEQVQFTQKLEIRRELERRRKPSPKVRLGPADALEQPLFGG